MAKNKNPLQIELEKQRFLHAVRYVRHEAAGIKKLTTTELSRTNQFLVGHEHDVNFDPWRIGSVKVKIPTGEVHEFEFMNNPMALARDLIGEALIQAGNQNGVEAATFIYSRLVLGHLFKEANRRTAVIATLWVLLAAGLDCDPEALLKIPIGNLRSPQSIQDLKLKIAVLVKQN